MSDKELKAHDLAIVVAQNLHPELNKQLDSSTLEFLCQQILEDYQSAYDYYIEHIEG